MKRDYKYFTEIFKPLGYFVLNRDLHKGKSDLFDLFVDESDRGLEWFGSFKYSLINKEVVYQLLSDEKIVSPSDVIKTISEHNKTKLCPSYCYCPLSKPFNNLCDAFHWYTKMLGFEHPGWEYGTAPNSRTMVYKNLYGETISKITLQYDDMDKTTGSIVRGIDNSWSWIASKFDGIDEMIGAINSIVEPEMLINVSKTLKTVDNMSVDRSDNVSFNKLNSDLNLYTDNAKNAIKLALQNALDNLN